MSEMAQTVKKASTGMMILSVLVILLGFVAIIVPEIAGIAVTLFIGWALLVAGIVEIAHAVGSGRGGSFFLHLLIGILDVIVGGYLIFHPAAALVTLTLVLAAIFVVDGVITLISGFRSSPNPGSGWMIFDGIISLLLGILIWAHWPMSSVWFIGTLIGIRLILEGTGRLFAASAVRSAAA
jgi:uncharacterized membrane protein HdeD (DUF308 family)